MSQQFLRLEHSDEVATLTLQRAPANLLNIEMVEAMNEVLLGLRAHRSIEVLIIRGSRECFGALILGVYDGERLVHVGRVGSGFDTKWLKDLHARLEPLLRKGCPFQKVPKTDSPARWVEPRLVCEVDFADWTRDGHMRHMVFLGLREDKQPRDVHRETSIPVSELGRVERTILRSAMFEVLYSAATPSGETIHDAVSLARTYAGDAARRLVSGVLASVSRSTGAQSGRGA